MSLPQISNNIYRSRVSLLDSEINMIIGEIRQLCQFIVSNWLILLIYCLFGVFWLTLLRHFYKLEATNEEHQNDTFFVTVGVFLAILLLIFAYHIFASSELSDSNLFSQLASILASIFAIVLSVTLVVIQLGATKYSFRVISLIFRIPFIWRTIVFFPVLIASYTLLGNKLQGTPYVIGVGMFLTSLLILVIYLYRTSKELLPKNMAKNFFKQLNKRLSVKHIQEVDMLDSELHVAREFLLVSLDTRDKQLRDEIWSGLYETLNTPLTTNILEEHFMRSLDQEHTYNENKEKILLAEQFLDRFLDIPRFLIEEGNNRKDHSLINEGIEGYIIIQRGILNIIQNMLEKISQEEKDFKEIIPSFVEQCLCYLKNAYDEFFKDFLESVEGEEQ